MAEISRSLNHEISRREGDMKALQKLQQRMGATGALENRFADVQNTVDQLLTKLKAKARGVLSAVRAAPAGKPSAPSRRGSTGSGSIMDRLLDAASKPGSAHSVKAKPTKQLPEVKLTTKPDHRAAAPGTPAAPIPFHENSKRVQSITVDLSNEGMARQATEPEKAKTHWVEIDEPEIRHRPIGPVVNDEVRIIVAGSRDYHNHANICETLDRIKDRAQAPVRIIDGPYYTGYGRPTGGYKAADSAPPAAPAPAPETAAKPAQAKTGSMMDQMLKKAAYQAPDEDTTRHAWGTNETQANDGPSRFKGGIGAAYLANQWAHMNNVTSTTYRANWEEDRDNARFQRNQRMLDHGRPHLVVAFLSGPEDPLTEHMVQIADKAGVPIEIADERGRTYAYNEARTDQYIPPPPAADDPKLDDPKLGMTVNPKKSQLDKQWFAYGEPKLKDEKSTADHKTAEPSPETVSGSKPSKRTGDTAKTATMDAILKRAYRTPGLMRGKNAPIGGAPPKPTASEPDKTQADARTTAGQGGDR